MEHHLQSTDTLQGLALRYHCRVADIKRLNQWQSDRINSVELPVVLIPVNDNNRPMNQTVDPEVEETHRRGNLVLAFKRKAKCTLEEAQFYLEDVGYESLDAALEMFFDDERWHENVLKEQRFAVLKAASSSSFSSSQMLTIISAAAYVPPPLSTA
eukprot:GFYU01000391.1.p1 GENE.GFYU01000391.1~~GFYU01000391.1.p1  ORF type:complete len:156 (-),score=58.26 GFYU01000391.1:365-832(-)